MSQQAMSQYKEPAIGGQGCEVVEAEGEPGDQGEDQGWHQQPAIRDVVMGLFRIIFKLRYSQTATSTFCLIVYIVVIYYGICKEPVEDNFSQKFC